MACQGSRKNTEPQLASPVSNIYTHAMYNSFSYTTGNPNFKGESFLHVTADGSATVKATRGANSETYTADLSPKENKDFWNAVTQLNPCSLKNSRLGQPGEDMLKFSVERRRKRCLPSRDLGGRTAQDAPPQGPCETSQRGIVQGIRRQSDLLIHKILQ
jgi:hypothetical protein